MSRTGATVVCGCAPRMGPRLEGRHRSVAAFALLAALSGVAAPAHGADRLWIGATGVPPGDGFSFADPFNWFRNGVPGPLDRAIFDGSPASVLFGGASVTSDRLLVDGAFTAVEFDLQGGVYQLLSSGALGDARSLVVGALPAAAGSLALRDGVLLGQSGAVAVAPGSDVELIVDADALVGLLGELRVGEIGSGALRVDGTLLSGAAMLGVEVDAHGAALLDLPTGLWLCFGDLLLGGAGTADATISGGARLLAGGAVRLAGDTGSSATLLASDPTTLVTVGTDLLLGVDAPIAGGGASVLVENDALIRVSANAEIGPTSAIEIAGGAFAATTLLVDGGMFACDATGRVVLAAAGTPADPGIAVGGAGSAGELRIRGGGSVEAPSVAIGIEPSATGLAVIESSGGTLAAGGDLRVGGERVALGRFGPDALLELEGGGVEATGSLVIGQRGLLRLRGGSASVGAAEFTDDGRVAVLVPAPAGGGATGVDAALPSTVGGGLFVELDGETPSNGSVVEILRAPSIDGRPSVVVSPLIKPFLTVEAPVETIGADEALRLRVRSLPLFLRFDEPGTTDLDEPPSAVAVAGFDADSAPDALVTVPRGRAPGVVQLLINQPAGPGVPPGLDLVATVEVGIDPAAIALGDLDGDGRPDVAASNRGDGTISLLRNNTGAALGPPIEPLLLLVAGGTPGGVAIADLDGDRVNDVVAANGDAIVIFLGDGRGGFGSPQLVQAGVSTQVVCPIDLNGDRDLDLVAVNFGVALPLRLEEAPSVTIHVNLGAGNFAPPTAYEVGAGPVALAEADLQGDGVVDLVTANSVAGTISVLLGNPDGTFLPAVDIDAAGFPFAIAAGDFDNDLAADTDIVVLVDDGLGSVSLTLFRNDSIDGQLVLTVIPDAETLIGVPAALASANVDLDGPVDLVTAGALGDPRADAAGPAAGAISLFIADPVACPGDIGGDGVVDGTDLGALLAAWGQTGPDLPADLNGDRVVNGEDLGLLLDAWGDCLGSG